MGEACEVLLFAHAMTGCSTTSALYNKGIFRGLKLIQNYEELREEMKIFNQKDAFKELTNAAGERFLLKLHRSTSSKSLDELILLVQPYIGQKEVGYIFSTSIPTSDQCSCRATLVQSIIAGSGMTGNCLEPTEWVGPFT